MKELTALTIISETEKVNKFIDTIQQGVKNNLISLSSLENLLSQAQVSIQLCRYMIKDDVRNELNEHLKDSDKVFNEMISKSVHQIAEELGI